MIQVNFQMGHENYQGGWIQGPDSAGGVSVRNNIKNVGGKTIKYYSLFFKPYNAVGDAVSCDITGVCVNGVKGTGPVEPGETTSWGVFRNAWYNYSIKSVELTSAIIQYTDGTTEVISGDKIENIAGGCYVATAVYGSYDCPQVWTLRRYRDYTLAETWYGRAFIRTYYAISPTLVKWFGDTKWFKKMWQGKLDRMVAKLQAEGIESTPYEDIKW